MNFLDLQGNVRDAIAAHPLFEADEEIIFVDLGDKRSAMDAALDVDNDGEGYCVAVWPPARGSSLGEASGADGVDSMIVVRLEVNPKMLSALIVSEADRDAAVKWLGRRINAIIGAVLAESEEAGGTRFRLAAEAFELANFDEGLVAYHVRFERFSVFEIDDDLVLPPPPTFKPPKFFRMTDSVTDEIVTVTIQDGQFQIET